MPSLKSIDGVSPRAAKLFDHLGIHQRERLASEDIDSLYPRLVETNKEIMAYKVMPKREVVAGWIAAAEKAGKDSALGQSDPTTPSDDNASPTPAPLLEEIPVARDFFTETGSRLRTETRPPEEKAAVGANAAIRRKALDLSRVHTFTDAQEGRLEVAPLGSAAGFAPQAAPIQARKLERLEAGPGETVSRWVMRGVQHPHPVRLYFAMLAVFISRLLFFAVIIGTPIVLGQLWLTGKNTLQSFLPVIIAFLIMGIVHLLIASRIRCKVCSCHLLFARRCHKNAKAHRLFPFGWVGSTALHGIVFRWFRCMYCGTPTQLKSRKQSRSAPA